MSILFRASADGFFGGVYISAGAKFSAPDDFEAGWAGPDDGNPGEAPLPESHPEVDINLEAANAQNASGDPIIKTADTLPASPIVEPEKPKAETPAARRKREAQEASDAEAAAAKAEEIVKNDQPVEGEDDSDLV